MKDGNERRFRRYMAYYKAVYGKDVRIDKVHKAPRWCCDRKKNAYAVYFRRGDQPKNGGAMLTGHGPSYDAAFKMLLDFYMRLEGTGSDSEMEIKYAAAGV